MVWRRIGLDGWGILPPPELVTKLQLEWMFQAPMYYGSGDPATAESEWPWCPGKKMVDLGITSIVGEYSGLEDTHATQMLYLRNQLALSLNHPEIVGIYLSDYYYSVRDGYRTRAEWVEVVNTIKTTNPNLKLYVAYTPEMEIEQTQADEYLSWISYNIVFCQMRVNQAGYTAEDMDGFLSRTEAKFAGKSIWGTLLLHDQNQTLLTEEQVRTLLEINKQHYDARKIQGLRVQHVTHLQDHSEYVDWIEEIFFATPTPPTHTLTVTSTPITVAYTINGLSRPTPYSEQLEQGTYTVTVPSNVELHGYVYNFLSWEDGSTNPTRTINLVSDLTITATYQLYTPPPPPKGNLQIHAFLDTKEIVVPYEVVEAGLVGNTPDTVELDPGIYTVTATYNTETKTETVEVLEAQTIRVDFQFVVTPPPAIPILPLLAVGGVILGAVLLGKS